MSDWEDGVTREYGWDGWHGGRDIERGDGSDAQVQPQTIVVRIKGKVRKKNGQTLRVFPPAYDAL